MNRQELNQTVKSVMQAAGQVAGMSVYDLREVATKAARQLNLDKVPTPKGQEYWTGDIIIHMRFQHRVARVLLSKMSTQ